MVVIWIDQEKGTTAWDTRVVPLLHLSGKMISACTERDRVLSVARFSSVVVAEGVFREIATLIHDEDPQERGPFLVEEYVINNFGGAIL